MSEDDLPPLAPDVAALLDEARGTDVAPPDARRRVAARLALTVGMVLPSASLAGARTLGRAWLAKALGVVALVALVGGSASLAHRRAAPPTSPPALVATHARAIAPPTAPRALTERPLPTVSPAAASPSAPSVASMVAAHAPARPSLGAAPTPDDDRAFQEELSLLDGALAALNRGDPSGASEALALHARRFPRGRLSPEREALRVRCAVARGDRAAAEAARQRFHQRYPNSVLGASVDRAVETAAARD